MALSRPVLNIYVIFEALGNGGLVGEILHEPTRFHMMIDGMQF